MRKTRSVLYSLLLLTAVGLMACSTTKVNQPAPEQASETITPNLSSSTSPTLTPSSTPTPAPTVTLTPTPAVTDTPTKPPTDTASDTVQIAPTVEPVLVATLPPDPYRQSSLPENVWWSQDSQTLFYQNIETQQAWAYDLATGTSSSIPYVPRAFRELAPSIKTTLPEGASLYSVSPHNSNVLYKIPLPEPVPLDPPRFNDSFNPAYEFELWLQKDGQIFNLGLVDDCFGLLGPPIWSANENWAVVNTYGTPDMSRACMHFTWLIDIETPSVGTLSVPWESSRGYNVTDLSADGQLLLIHADVNYIYNLKTGEESAIPEADTDRAILVETDKRPTCLILKLEFSASTLQDHVWYCVPTEDGFIPLATIPGMISQWIVSPDKKFVAFTVKNDFPPGEFYEDVNPGIWLVTLP